MKNLCINHRDVANVPPGTRLSEFLARKGLPLNTRCNQQGVCGGCEVLINDEKKPIKACEYRIEHDTDLNIFIPHRSLLRHHPVAVSDFQTFVPIGSAPAFSGRFGLALDLGTTTVALLLANLESGEILSKATGLNTQSMLGDNVLSRIQACQDDKENIFRLREEFWRGTFQPLLQELLDNSSVQTADIGGIVIAGNTTMLHLACGVDPTSLGRYPFQPKFLNALEFPGSEFSLPSSWTIRFLPGISAFVGADITAGTICCGLNYPGTVSLLVDIGTNGEIFLASPFGSVATATAAGPAFEGCGLLCGMRAAKGAIGHLAIDDATLDVSIDVIGGKGQKAHGIAGSAYIDFLAEGRRVGLLTENGRFSKEAIKMFPARFLVEENGNSFLLQSNSDVLRIGEVDVAMLLQAKAAIAAGIETLLARSSLPAGDISRLYLAGGFGRHIAITNAISCGLLPGFSGEQVCAVGNTALGGAYLAMLDENLIDEMSSINASTLELNEDPSFEDRFLENLLLPEPPGRFSRPVGA